MSVGNEILFVLCLTLGGQRACVYDMTAESVFRAHLSETNADDLLRRHSSDRGAVTNYYLNFFWIFDFRL